MPARCRTQLAPPPCRSAAACARLRPCASPPRQRPSWRASTRACACTRTWRRITRTLSSASAPTAAAPAVTSSARAAAARPELHGGGRAVAWPCLRRPSGSLFAAVDQRQSKPALTAPPPPLPTPLCLLPAPLAATRRQVGWDQSDCWFAHCVMLDGEEQRLFAEHGLGVAHCPSSNCRLASGARACLKLLAGCEVQQR